MVNSLPLELRVGRPRGSRVVQDYLAGEPAALDFYGRRWDRAASYADKAAEVDRRFDRDARRRAAEALVGSPDDDGSRLDRFVEQGGYMVTTGQQPALFGGPLYSVHKALTAVRLAEALEARLERPVLPVFWVASEDHDWAEANHTDVIGVDNELHRFEVEAPDPSVHPPLHRVRLDGRATSRVSEFLDVLPQTDFSAEYVELVRRAFAAGCTLPEGFHRLMQRLVGRFGLHFTDASHPELKRLSMPTLLAELERAEELERTLDGTGRRLTAAGYDLQVALLEGGVNLFLEGPAGRERLYRDDGGFRLRSSELRIGLEDVRERCAQDAAVLSPNVLLRPVVESAVFPTLAYVGGPGEIAYFAQLPDYFRAHGLEMPVVYPRFSVTPVETKIRKVLDKFGLDVDALERPFHEVAAQVARDEVPPAVRSALGSLRGAIGKGVGELQQAVRDIDPTLKGPVQHLRGQAFAAIDDVERKVLTALKRENEIALSQLEKAQVHLFPHGKPAERVQNPLYYLTRFGDAFLDGLYESFRVELS